MFRFHSTSWSDKSFVVSRVQTLVMNTPFFMDFQGAEVLSVTPELL